MLITSPANIFYLSGFNGSAGLLVISADNIFLVVDSRYTEQAKLQSPHTELYPLKEHFTETIALLLKEYRWANIAFEEDKLSFYDFKLLSERVKTPLLPHYRFVEKNRMVKENYEIGLIKKAASITDESFSDIVRYLKPGIKETDIAAELEYILKKKGADGPSFRFIVASGKRSALPHGVASEKILQEGDLVTIDFGAAYKGYLADMTRTVFLGNPKKRHREIWSLVNEAGNSALKGLRKGVRSSEIDSLARKVIVDGGFGKNFGHGLGHGLGIEAHEAPVLSYKGKDKLVPGMVITIEPGIYIPDWGGIRIEDMVLINDDGYEILSKSNRGLEV